MLPLVVWAWGGRCLLGEPIASEAPPAVAAFTLSFAIAKDEAGRPVADPEWLAGEIDAANALFAPAGVAFARSFAEPLASPLRHVETRADRDALAPDVKPRVVNVFVVDSLRDVDDPAEMRRGVHWHVAGGVHYVILVATASLTVLAHELGHFFGNPHSHVVDNIMSYERSGGWVFFDAAQQRTIAARARSYLATGELDPLR